jgi:hypothetical protein
MIIIPVQGFWQRLASPPLAGKTLSAYELWEWFSKLKNYKNK